MKLYVNNNNIASTLDNDGVSMVIDTELQTVDNIEVKLMLDVVAGILMIDRVLFFDKCIVDYKLMLDILKQKNIYVVAPRKKILLPSSLKFELVKYIPSKIVEWTNEDFDVEGIHFLSEVDCRRAVQKLFKIKLKMVHYHEFTLSNIRSFKSNTVPIPPSIKNCTTIENYVKYLCKSNYDGVILPDGRIFSSKPSVNSFKTLKDLEDYIKLTKI